MHPPTAAGEIRAITVYCGASQSVHSAYYDLAAEVGRAIALSGRRLVYGGGSVGLMGAMSRACREAGGKATGVITRRLCDAELLDRENEENVILERMRDRKRMMEERGDAFIVLPGGFGTLEEFFEILTGRLLGEHDKPIVLVNAPDPLHNGERRYFDPLIEMVEHMIDRSFAKRGAWELVRIAPGAAEAVAALDGARVGTPRLRAEHIPSASGPSRS